MVVAHSGQGVTKDGEGGEGWWVLSAWRRWFEGGCQLVFSGAGA